MSDFAKVRILCVRQIPLGYCFLIFTRLLSLTVHLDILRVVLEWEHTVELSRFPNELGLPDE